MRITILDKHLMTATSLMYVLKDIHTSLTYSICTDVSTLLAELNHKNSDVLLMEVTFKDGFELIKDIRKKCPKLRIIVLSTYADSKIVRKCMQRGADGYIHKGNHIDELRIAIDEVLKGHTYMGEGIRTSPSPLSKESKVTVDYADSTSLRRSLTRREQEVLKLIADGKTNRVIGDELYISHQTVGVHRKNIMRKLRVNSSASLMKMAIEKELV